MKGFDWLIVTMGFQAAIMPRPTNGGLIQDLVKTFFKVLFNKTKLIYYHSYYNLGPNLIF